MSIHEQTDLRIAKTFLSVDLRLLALVGVIMGSDHQTFIVVVRSVKSFLIWANPGLFLDYYCKAFYKLNYNRRIDNQLGISAPC